MGAIVRRGEALGAALGSNFGGAALGSRSNFGAA